MTDERAARIAHALRTALETRTPIEPISPGIRTLEEAYRVQGLVMGPRETDDNPLVGHKVGLTAHAVRAQLGVDQPDFGLLLADMEVRPGSPIDLGRLIQPKIEAEIAFVLDHDVDALDRDSVLDSVEYATPALEIVDSRIADWRISLFDTVADNASSGLYLLGDGAVDPRRVDLREVEMSMSVDGEVVSTGRGSACLGDPVEALVWVARTAAGQGRPLRAGEVILSGALGPMVPLRPGMRITAGISQIGHVSATTGGTPA
ncbi:2-keto-4-pentenoate hydratase [Agromyces aerolatus]|uniref:2-keto-4-pentenoate hydratase n=1 Tax=Agromyces sp. LY-1074 TaxID=3074080 RepID=UPI0028613B00|nr:MULTISPECIES: fumarylacetoacetate hydrolase family protein [unclassified Agromyces]MDR5699429.1 fumarylacetoacetate hydrolase family protein [Agromyces sp. LY-1074]MDR5705725.1 fumarylacetoacetate hydrolase family protein [Agromyces sp. LY-1358]